MAHSKIVGGSTAKRVMACPGSVALCAAMPPKPSNAYADEGTLLHTAIARLLTEEVPELLGMTYEGVVLTEELMEQKLIPAYQMMDAVDPNQEMEYDVEVEVSFGDLIPEVFGSADLVGRLGNTAVILDWKFGDGLAVDAEENPQLMFYAAAAMRTPTAKWAFDGAKEIALMIGQPTAGGLKQWVTTPERIRAFEQDLICAVAASEKKDAKLVAGEHCRWCAAKPVCPKMTGAVDRALKVQLEALDAEHINAYLKNADLLEQWIKDLRALAFTMMEKGVSLPDWKLVQKRALRKWRDESAAAKKLLSMGVVPYKPQELVSPAQAERLLKPRKLTLPDDLAVAESSGVTFAERSDPRPEVLQIGQQLAALSKLV